MATIDKERIDSIRTMAYELKRGATKISDVNCAIAVMELCDDWHWDTVAQYPRPSVAPLTKSKPVNDD